jgi:hypothetical protein
MSREPPHTPAMERDDPITHSAQLQHESRRLCEWSKKLANDTDVLLKRSQELRKRSAWLCNSTGEAARWHLADVFTSARAVNPAPSVCSLPCASGR